MGEVKKLLTRWAVEFVLGGAFGLVLAWIVEALYPGARDDITINLLVIGVALVGAHVTRKLILEEIKDDAAKVER